MFLRLCVAGGVIAGCRNQANNAISPNTIENNKQNILAARYEKPKGKTSEEDGSSSDVIDLESRRAAN